MSSKDLFNILQLKYFVKKIQTYFSADLTRVYLNYDYLVMNWLLLDYNLNKFPYFIEYKSFIEFLKENFEVIFTYYLILKQDKSKLMQIYNLVNDSVMKNDDEMIVVLVMNFLVKHYVKHQF